MPSTLLGLIEMVFVLSMALGWATFELVRLRRLGKRSAPRPKDVDRHGS